VTTAGSILLSFILPCLLLVSFESSVAAQARKAIVQGASHVNLRSGPNLKHPSVRILKEGDEMTVEGEAGAWYLVALTDGQKGYVHRSIVRLIGDEPAQVAFAEKTTVEAEKPVQTSEPPKPGKPPTPALVPRADEAQTTPTTSAEKPRSLLHFLEGRQEELLLYLVVSVVFFVIGWICGGNYYLKRDRARRTKLRF